MSTSLSETVDAVTVEQRGQQAAQAAWALRERYRVPIPTLPDVAEVAREERERFVAAYQLEIKVLDRSKRIWLGKR